MIFDNNSIEKFNSFAEKKIICYGLDKHLEELFEYLDIYDRVECFCVPPGSSKTTQFCVGEHNYPVCPISSLLLYSPKDYIILIVEEQITSALRYLNKQALINQDFHVFHKLLYNENDRFLTLYPAKTDCYSRLELATNKKNIDYKNYGYENASDFKKAFIDDIKESKKTIIPLAIFDVTRRCTLKCKDCCALTNRYENCPKSDINVNDLINDIDVFLDSIDCLITLELIGGETFLYKDLDIVLEHLIKNKKVLSITIMTNITIIPNEKTIQLIKNPKVRLGVSIYNENENTKKFADIIKKNNISATYKSFIGKRDWIPGSDDRIDKWISMGDLSKRDISKQQEKDEYLICSSRACRTVLDGKLYKCQFSARMHDLGLIEYPCDYVDLRKENNRTEKIKEIYTSTSCSTCSHCRLSDIKNGEVITGGLQK